MCVVGKKFAFQLLLRKTNNCADLNTANNNIVTSNNNEDSMVERELEELKRFFSRFAPSVSHHNIIQYSHLCKTLILFLNFYDLRSLKSTNLICTIPGLVQSLTCNYVHMY